jgi:hypothetical protein
VKWCRFGLGFAGFGDLGSRGAGFAKPKNVWGGAAQNVSQ